MFGKRAEGVAVKSPAVQAAPRKVDAKDTKDTSSKMDASAIGRHAS